MGFTSQNKVMSTVPEPDTLGQPRRKFLVQVDLTCKSFTFHCRSDLEILRIPVKITSAS